MLSRNTIDKVREIDLSTLISKHVTLKKSGSNLKGSSPFSEDKSASFVVSKSKGCWKCFSTGKGGADAISFIQELRNYNFIEAVKELADEYGIDIEPNKGKESQQYLKKVAEIRNIEKINSLALEYFLENAAKTPAEISKRCKKKVAETLSIGYAPKSGLVKWMKERNVSEDALIDCGLAGRGETNVYDFFRERVIFPIFSHRGTILGFSGRIAIDKKDTGKTINSRDTAAYCKSESLLGIYHAKKEISRKNAAILVEGNHDFSSIFGEKVENVVGNLGTALTDEQARLLKKFCNNVTIYGDNDAPGITALIKNTQTLVTNGLNVKCILTEIPTKTEDGEEVLKACDPDDFVNHKKWEAGELKLALDEASEDAVVWVANKLYEKAQTIPEKSAAQNELINLISSISDPSIRKAYIESFKKYNIKITDVESRLKVSELDKRSKSREKYGAHNLPSHVSEEQIVSYGKYNFYADTKLSNYGYHFKQEGGACVRRSNCIIKPIFQVKTQDDNKRIVEITNDELKILVELNYKAFSTKQNLHEQLIKNGPFWFTGSVLDYNRWLTKILSEFTWAKLIQTLGWQKTGFFAFADGVLDGAFKKVDSFGICTYDDQDYYLPAFSKINIEVDEEDDMYESARALVYRPSTISFKEWGKKITRVHGENGYWSAIFFVTSLFREFIFSSLSYYPHMFNFGPVGSGKSACARAINSIFFGDQVPHNLKSGSSVGFTRVMARVRNAIVWLDEYNNDIDENKFNTLKSSFDGAGREVGVKSNDNRTKKTRVNSAVYLSGQYLPNRDGNSLFTRSIMNYFNEKPEKRSQEDDDAFLDLTTIQQEGLSGLIEQVIIYRDEFCESFRSEFQEQLSLVKIKVREKSALRVIETHTVMLTTAKLLGEKLGFPYSYEETFDQTIKRIVYQSSQVQESDELSEFWIIIEALSFNSILYEREQYLIKDETSITIRENGNDKTLDFEGAKKILYVRFNLIHSAYMKGHREKHSETGIKDQSIKHYLKHSGYFLGNAKLVNFNGHRTSAYALDYESVPAELKQFVYKKEKNSEK